MGKFIEYKIKNKVYEGYLSLPKDKTTKRPCIVFGHAWDGNNAFFNAFADEWAAKGFVSFALDVYGKGIRGDVSGDNSHLMNPLLEDRKELLNRLQEAIDFIKTVPQVDPEKIIMIGHCFGGLCALDLARSNPKGLLGCVTVHAPLHRDKNFKEINISAKILTLHGWEDPVAKNDVTCFINEMNELCSDWQIHAYGHTLHGFTFVGADLPHLGVKYSAEAHHRSSTAIENFVNEIFKD